MKTSIIITSYRRPLFLQKCLESLCRQNLESLDCEVIVVNDGPPDDGTREISKQFGPVVRYVHSGRPNNRQWRVMGFAANIGIRQSQSEIVILTNSDIYHLNETVAPIIKVCASNPFALSTPKTVYDDEGSFVACLMKEPENTKKLERAIQHIKGLPPPKHVFPSSSDMPFFMAIRRDHLEYIGGYDEDFTGIGLEDCDLLDRLTSIGCDYCYVNDAKMIHLYHGRRTIAQLHKDPGFLRNLALRQDRRGKIFRNIERSWGSTTPQAAEDAPLSLALFVTGLCSLKCPNCNQRVTRNALANYWMQKSELEHIVSSCKRRNIHFRTIEITGGEPSLWPILEWGLKFLNESGIADYVTFVTNGNNAREVARLARRQSICYTVSSSQATKLQIEEHKRHGPDNVSWNEHQHRSLPKAVVQDSLPAICSQQTDRLGQAMSQLSYIQGNIYYCCLAYANSAIVGSDPRYVCSFDDDFVSHFAKRKFDVPICSVCVCNEKVWNTIKMDEYTLTMKRYWENAHSAVEQEKLTCNTLETHLEYLGLEVPQPESRVLCVGVGDGAWISSLVSSCALTTVYALDISERANVQPPVFLINNPAQLPINTFDLAISLWVAPHMNDEDLATQLRHVIKSLSDEGMYAIHYNESLADHPMPQEQTVGVARAGSMVRDRETFLAMVKAGGGTAKIVKCDPHPQYQMQMVVAHVRRAK